MYEIWRKNDNLRRRNSLLNSRWLSDSPSSLSSIPGDALKKSSRPTELWPYKALSFSFRIPSLQASICLFTRLVVAGRCSFESKFSNTVMRASVTFGTLIARSLVSRSGFSAYSRVFCFQISARLPRCARDQGSLTTERCSASYVRVGPEVDDGRTERLLTIDGVKLGITLVLKTFLFRIFFLWRTIFVTNNTVAL